MFNRITRKLSGADALERAVAEIQDQLSQGANRGLREQSVYLREGDLGAFIDLRTAEPLIVSSIQDRGYAVVDTHLEHGVLRLLVRITAPNASPGNEGSAPRQGSDVPVAPGGEYFWRKATTSGPAISDVSLFNAMEDSIPPESRVSGDPKFELVQSPVGYRCGELLWADPPIGLLLAESSMLLARPSATGVPEIVMWSRWELPRFGFGQTEAGPALRLDHESGQVIMIFYETLEEAEALGVLYRDQ